MKESTLPEIETAREIIAQGLQKSAQSLSFFMKEDMQLRETAFHLGRHENAFLNSFKSDDEFYVLSTHLKGDLNGLCFFIFTPEEKEELCRMALPAAMLDKPEGQQMKEMLLLEVDNIISASVVTELANRLSLKVYGDVPSLTVLRGDALAALINVHTEPDRLMLEFQTEFISSKSHFHPEFIWIVEPGLVERVKQLQARANG